MIISLLEGLFGLASCDFIEGTLCVRVGGGLEGEVAEVEVEEERKGGGEAENP